MSEKEVEIWHSKITSMLDIIAWKHLKLTDHDRAYLSGSKDFKAKTIQSVLAYVAFFIRFIEGDAQKLVRSDIAHAVAVFGSIQEKDLKDIDDSTIEVFMAHIGVVVREVSNALFD